MEYPEQRPAWAIKQHLNASALIEYVSRFNIHRSQVVGITESKDGDFTLIFEPNAEQYEQLATAEEQATETLDSLFGATVTPVQTPSGSEVETVVAIPAGPGVRPPFTPYTDPSLS